VGRIEEGGVGRDGDVGALSQGGNTRVVWIVGSSEEAEADTEAGVEEMAVLGLTEELNTDFTSVCFPVATLIGGGCTV
jgi:hypothetical protein